MFANVINNSRQWHTSRPLLETSLRTTRSHSQQHRRLWRSLPTRIVFPGRVAHLNKAFILNNARMQNITQALEPLCGAASHSSIHSSGRHIETPSTTPGPGRPATHQAVLVQDEHARRLVEGSRRESPSVAAPRHGVHLGRVRRDFSTLVVVPEAVLHLLVVLGRHL